MAGLLTHLGIALIGFLLTWFIFGNYKYGLGFVIGHLIPDLISFGIIGAFTFSVNPSMIMLSPWFISLAALSHTLWHWIIFGILFFLILFILYKFKIVSKKKFKMISLLLLIFLVAVGIHLIIDATIIETNYWI